MELELLEEIAFGDRAKAVGALVPGTEDYFLHLCLHHEHEGNDAEVDRLLTVWTERHGRTAQVQKIERRRLLLRFDRDPAATAEQLRADLGFTFSHARAAGGEEVRHPTRLPAHLLARETLERRVLARSPGTLDGFTDRALYWLAERQLTAEQRGQLLDRLPRPDLPSLTTLVLADLAEKRSAFGSRRIHQRMTLAQLEELEVKSPRLLTQPTFVLTYVQRLLPDADQAPDADPTAREAHLDRLWAFVSELEPAFNSLKGHVLYHRLVHDRAQGTYDRGRFLAFIALPRSASWAQRAPGRPAPDEHLTDLGRDFSSATGLPSPTGELQLIESYLEHLFAAGEPYEQLTRWLSEPWLRRTFALTKLRIGSPEPERWAAMLDDPALLQQLEEKVELELAPENPRHHRPHDPVCLLVDVANVETLLVKVFELDTLGHFMATGTEPDLSVDLDGLVANHEHTLRFTEARHRRVRRRIELPELSRPGTFVVELIGGGRSSRALIRKGTLGMTERIGAAGHTFTILDDDGHPAKGATLWLEGQEYQPDETGEIVVPFSTLPRERTVLLRSGDVTSAATFQRRAETYTLSAGLHVPREQLVAGVEASLIVRPYLLVCETPVSIELLESPVLWISATDRDGVETTREIPAPELRDDRETVVTFHVPRSLARLSLGLRGKVRSASEQQDVELSDSTVLELNGIDATPSIEAFHLSETAGGFVLYLLGKTGEPRVRRVVSLSFAHRDFAERFHGTLETDASGRIELGSLPGVTLLEARSATGVQASFPLGPPRPSHPARLHVLAGRPFRAFFTGDSVELERGAVSLFALRGEAPFADELERVSIEGGWLQIAGLPAGDHELILADHHVRIPIAVSAGEEREGWLVSRARKLEAPAAPPPGLSNLRLGPEGLELEVSARDPSTRVHVFGARFLSGRSAFAALGQAHDPALQVLDAEPPRSEQVSGRDIGDEYRYVLERRHAKRRAGNLLSRPGLLLNPWSVRTTSSSRQEAESGDSYAAAKLAAARSARRPAPAPAQQSGGHFESLDFLMSPSVALVNLVPDSAGRIAIPRSALAEVARVELVVVCDDGAARARVLLPEPSLRARDLRLLSALDPAEHFVATRRITPLLAGERLELLDAASAKAEIVDTLGRAAALLGSLSGGEPLEELAFVLEWTRLSEPEKCAKYSKHACHELSFFIARKDPNFFATVVAPYLANKRDKTFLDEWLLGMDLSRWTGIWEYGRLNVLERVLLGERLEAEREAARRATADRVEVLPPDPETEDRIFRAGLRGRALEGGGGPVGGAAPPAAFAAGAFAVADAEASTLGARSGAGMRAMDLGEADDESPAPEEQAKERSKAKKRDVARRRAVRAAYRPVGSTEEWAEHNYWHRRASEHGPELLPVNAFWRDYAARDRGSPFLSPHFPLATSSVNERLLALAVLDLPFEVEGSSLQLTPADPGQGVAAGAAVVARAPLIVFHEELVKVAGSEGRTKVLVGQSCLRADDPWTYEGGEQVEKYVTGELLSQVVYTTKVIVTNPTSARQKLDLLLQIPRGAVPTSSGFETKTVHISLPGYSTHTAEYSYYFPLAGAYSHFPVHASIAGALVASAPAPRVTVVDRATTEDERSWAHVSQHSPAEVLLAYLERENLERIDLELAAWRLRDASLWSRIVAILTRRRRYDRTVWSYALHHGDRARIGELLAHEGEYLRTAGVELQAPLLSFQPVVRAWYEHLEYAPLVHARAHRLGASRRILDHGFEAQYRAFLELLAHKPRPSDEELLEAAYYLLLQDRVEDAAAVFARIRQEEVHSALQRDYLEAYLAISEQQPGKARALAELHRHEPVDRWRKLFEAISAQLDELEEKAPEVVDSGDRGQRHAELAGTEPALELEVEAGKAVVRWQNLSQCTVRWHQMDVELLFSRQPFLTQAAERFSVVKPDRADVLTLPAARGELELPVPTEYGGRSVLLEVAGAGVRRARVVYTSRLVVRPVEPYGLLSVRDRQGGRALAATYVKVYARTAAGEVRFHKDGYTDLRGVFDYATLSGGVDDVEKLAVLVQHDELGAVIREVAPPRR